MSESKTVNALQSCVNNMDVELNDKYIAILFLLLFYITTQQSYTLIDNINMPCKGYISRDQYDDFISSFVFFVISFILIIIIKYYGINTINNFTFYNKLNKNIKDKGKDTSLITLEKARWDNKEMEGKILRSKYVLGLLLSTITNILNLTYGVLIMITLYKIIDQFLILAECASDTCPKQNLCSGKDGAIYYDTNNLQCLDKNGSFISEDSSSDKTPDNSSTDNSSTDNSSTDNSSTDNKKDIQDSKLKKDFEPPLIVYFLDTWSPIEVHKFKGSFWEGGQWDSTTSITPFKIFGFYVTCALLLCLIGLYIVYGKKDRKINVLFEVMIIYIPLNILIMLIRAAFIPID
jgi:hypothetical protein